MKCTVVLMKRENLKNNNAIRLNSRQNSRLNNFVPHLLALSRMGHMTKDKFCYEAVVRADSQWQKSAKSTIQDPWPPSSSLPIIVIRQPNCCFIRTKSISVHDTISRTTLSGSRCDLLCTATDDYSSETHGSLQIKHPFQHVVSNWRC